MDKNWCVLLIAILREQPCTREHAVQLYDNGNLFRNKRPKEDIEDMVKFREMGLKFKEIAEIFCLTQSTVCNLVNTFNKKIAPCQEPNN
ncbi:hypothetical protein NZ45_09890 [Clostridium botulinum]|uniref:Helix-turn-helix domain-containing protein n=1 Tax=Clostridium botulinum TaxID=1491 RepID=A0ABD7CLM6_CLOBO|nr:helix-turn-helix domain-containing protein [Clostridium botulinum]KGO13868.1 hypothetical protein NZ45_09890 [Clostridium botulinum]QRI54035.1 helix-turn-helix domain-containing protein [Clostridium botulinum]